jgi:folate-binding Fe-S cluster repair protein YgfZ
MLCLLTRWHGKDRVKFLEQIVVGDIAGLKEVRGGEENKWTHAARTTVESLPWCIT